MKKISYYYVTPLFALAGLILGVVFFIIGQAPVGHGIWIVTMTIGTLPLIFRMIKDIINGHFGVDVVAIAAIIASFIFGEYLAGIVILLMLSGGEALESRALKRARKELSSLISNAPTFAHIEENGVLKDVSVTEIKIGDMILIKPGEIIAADGIIVEGKSQLNESAITGESMPVAKEIGGMVFSGSINSSAVLRVKVIRPASESKYEQIIKLIKQAEENRAPVVRLADRYSVWFTIITFTLSGAAWLLSGESIRFLAVLVVATPCPLILATPVAIISGLSKSASRGIIVKSGGALETLAEINAMIFDKTGTLTLGQPEIVQIVPLGMTESEVLRISASLDQLSLHILARSLQLYAVKNSSSLSIPSNFKENFGNGVNGEIEGHVFYFGKLKFLEQQGIRIKDDILENHKNFQEKGQIAVYLGNEKEILGAVVFADTIRPEIKNLFTDLKMQGLSKIIMLTGDKKSVADHIADELGLDDVHAEALPADKVFEVEEHKKQFGKVAMIGDGVNDAPALAIADVGIAMGGHGSSATSDSSDIVITIDSLERVGEAYKIAKNVLMIAKQGIFFGIGVSIVLMIIAAFGFISPVYGAIIQEVLDVIVILNALRVNLLTLP
jgi:heavy metal translocating P-type ATPase